MSALLAVAPVIEDPAFTAPVIEYADLAPDPDRPRGGRDRRPGRGVRAAAGPAAPCSWPWRSAASWWPSAPSSSTPRRASSRRRARWPSTARRSSCRAPCCCSRSAPCCCSPSARSTRRATPSRRGRRPCPARPRSASSPSSRSPRPRSTRWRCSRLAGMMLFPASNDLLTMFVALEVLSLPLYLLAGMARRRRLLSQEAALKYFLLGAFSSAFFLFGVGAALRLLRHRLDLRHRPRRRGHRRPRPAAALRGRARRGRPAVQGRRRAVPRSGRPTSTRARPPPSPRSWPRAPRWPRSARCCGSSTSRSARSAGTGGR